jgi:hypothetical protein
MRERWGFHAANLMSYPKHQLLHPASISHGQNRDPQRGWHDL